MITEIKGCTTGGERVRLIACSEITRNPIRLRDEMPDRSLLSLADSIHRHGILVPLTVCRADTAERGYVLISGQRRLRAAEMLGIQSVPCIIMPHSERICAEFAVIESLQNRELNFFEQAQAIDRLITVCGLTRDEAARRLSCSQSYIANKLRLLRLTDSERELIIERGLSERHARAVLRIADPDERLAALREIAASTMTVAAAEELIERRVCRSVERSDPKPQRSVRDVTPFTNTLTRALRSLELAGVHCEVQRIDGDGFVEFRIRIPTKAFPSGEGGPRQRWMR